MSEKAYLVPGNGPGIEMQLATSSYHMPEVSYSLWVKVVDLKNTAGWVISQAPDYHYSRAIALADSRFGGVGLSNDPYANAGNEFGFPGLELNEWIHLVGIYEKTFSPVTSSCTLYVNGVASTRSCRNGASSSGSETEYLFIGGHTDTYYGSVHNPEAYITDVAVYNRKLLTSEVHLLYNRGLRISQLETWPVTGNMIVNLRGDVGMGVDGVWYNQVSGYSHATVETTRGVTYDASTRAYLLPGNNGGIDLVNLPTSGTKERQVTYSLWVYVLDLKHTFGWIIQQAPDFGYSRAIALNDYRFGYVGLANNPALHAGDRFNVGSLQLNQWIHLVGYYNAYNGAANGVSQCYMWVNGVKSNIRECYNGWDGSGSATEYLFIGGRRGSRSTHSPQAYVTDVAVYTRQLTDSEVQRLYNSGRRYSKPTWTPATTTYTTETSTTATFTTATSTTTTSTTATSTTTTSTTTTSTATTSATATSTTTTSVTATSTTATSTTTTSATETSTITTSRTATSTTTTSTTATTTTATSTTATSTTTTSSTATTTTTTTTSSSATVTSTTSSSLTSSTTTTTSSTASTTTSQTTTGTTTTSTTTPAESADALLSNMGSVESGLVGSLLQGNSSNMTVRVAGATVAAVKLSASELASAGDAVFVPVTGTEAEVVVPTSVFSDLGIQDVVMAVTAFDPESLTSLGSGESASDATGGSPPVEVRAAVNVNLLGQNGSRLSVSGLSNPIRVALPVNASAGVQCAYWDEQRHAWATDGLAARTSESGGPLVCESSHLTLFGAIWTGFVSTFECSQISLMNAEAISELPRGQWHYSRGAIILWAVVGVTALFFARSIYLDMRRRRKGGWQDEMFLIPGGEDAGAGEDDNGEEEDDGPPRGRIACLVCAMVSCFSACCCAVFTWMKESTALRDAFDDIMSNWFSNFSEVRGFIEDLMSAVTVDASVLAAGQSRTVVLLSRMTGTFLEGSVRRQISASMGISNEFFDALLDDENIYEMVCSHHKQEMKNSPTEGTVVDIPEEGGGDLDNVSRRGSDASSGPVANTMSRNYSKATHATQASSARSVCVFQNPDELRRQKERARRNGHEDKEDEGMQQQASLYSSDPGRRKSRKSLRTLPMEVQRELLLARIHSAANQHLDVHMLSIGKCTNTLWAVWRNLQVANPLQSATLYCIFTSSTLRTFYFALDIMGAMMIGTLFFTASGTVSLKKRSVGAGCSASDAGAQIGRLLAVGIGSLLVSGIPVTVLGSMHNRSFKRFPYKGCPEWKKQLRVWRVQDRIIWTLGGLYMAFCLFFMSVFLANITEEDSWSWGVSALISVAHSLIGVPMLISLLWPFCMLLTLNILSCVTRTDKRELIRLRREKLAQTNLTLPAEPRAEPRVQTVEI